METTAPEAPVAPAAAVNARAFFALRHAAASRSGRVLDCVRVGADGTVEATNGHFCLIAKPDSVTDAAEELPPPPSPMLVSSDAIGKASKIYKAKEHIPAFRGALAFDAAGATVTEAGNASTVRLPKVDGEEEFPILERVIPRGAPVLQVTLSVDLLERLCKIAKELADEDRDRTLRLTFHEDPAGAGVNLDDTTSKPGCRIVNNGITVDVARTENGPRVSGVLMPVIVS